MKVRLYYIWLLSSQVKRSHQYMIDKNRETWVSTSPLHCLKSQIIFILVRVKIKRREILPPTTCMHYSYNHKLVLLIFLPFKISTHRSHRWLRAPEACHLLMRPAFLRYPEHPCPPQPDTMMTKADEDKWEDGVSLLEEEIMEEKVWHSYLSEDHMLPIQLR